MNYRFAVAALAILSVVVGCDKAADKPVTAAAPPAHIVHWSYEGEGAPEHWGGLKPEYATCKDGKQQSPINIDSKAVSGKAEPIVFDYKTHAETIINNGHTIQVNMAKGSSISVAGKTYDLLQFHFHAPSEHTVDGRAADMVVHLVHKAADGQLGVIGVMMTKGAANPGLEKIWAKLPKKTGDSAGLTEITFSAAELLPPQRHYYNYAGSLTTPPCSEGVNWMVMQDGIGVSAEQVAAFTVLFVNSTRPVQPLHGRTVSSSK